LRAHRNEIASCEEAAYNSLPVDDAMTLLFFTNQHELMLFAQQVRANRVPSHLSPVSLSLISPKLCTDPFFLPQRHWQVDLVNRVILFPRKGENGSIEIPTRKVISQALTCARELEQIV